MFFDECVYVGIKFFDTNGKVMAHMCGDMITVGDSKCIYIVIGVVILSKWGDHSWFNWDTRLKDSTREKGFYLVTAQLDKMPKLHVDEDSDVSAFNLNDPDIVTLVGDALHMFDLFSKSRPLTFHYVWESDRWWLHQEACLLVVILYNYFTSAGQEQFIIWLRSERLSLKQNQVLRTRLKRRKYEEEEKRKVEQKKKRKVEDEEKRKVEENETHGTDDMDIQVGPSIMRADTRHTEQMEEKLFEAVSDRAFKAAMAHVQEVYAVVSTWTLHAHVRLVVWEVN